MPYQENAGARLKGNVYDYRSADKFLGSRDRRKIANNTYLERGRDEFRNLNYISAVLHHTAIVTFWHDALVLNSGGYHTVTTKARMNAFLESYHLRVEQTDFEWYVRNWDTQEKWYFMDGMTVYYTGLVIAPESNPSGRYSRRAREFMSEEIPHLVRDRGYEPKRAVAAAMSIARRKRMKVPPASNPYLDRPEAEFGSISTGTLKLWDLLPRFTEALEEAWEAYDQPPEVREALDRYDEIEDEAAHGGDPDEENAMYLLDEITILLADIAPPYGYFGSVEGDAADFGWWPLWDAIDMAVQDGDLLKVNDWDEVPDDYVGEVLQVNERGNTVFGYTTGGASNFEEVWSLV